MNEYEIKNELIDLIKELKLIRDKISKLKTHTHLKIKSTKNEREKILIYNKFNKLLSKIKKDLSIDVKYKKLKKREKELKNMLSENSLNSEKKLKNENCSINNKIIKLKEKYENDIINIDFNSETNIIIKKKDSKNEEIFELENLINNLKLDINEN